jgi:hypothetical protein
VQKEPGIFRLVAKTGLLRDSIAKVTCPKFRVKRLNSLEPVQAKLQVVVGLASRLKRVLVDPDA